jgi:MFS family permease
VNRPALVTALMALAYVVNLMNQAIVLVVAEQLKADFTLTDAQLGTVIGLSYMLFSALGALPLGRVADLYPRSVVVGLSLALMGVATTATSIVQSYWSMIIMRAAAGTGDAGVLPGAVSMISDHVSPAKRPLALSVFNAGGSIGAVMVYVLMGFVAQNYGWRTAYFWVGLLGIVTGLFISLALSDRSRQSTVRTLEANSLKTLTQLLRVRSFCHIVLAFIAFGMTSSATWNWISPVLQRTYSFSVAEAGTLLGLGAGVATAMGSLFYGAAASRLRMHNASLPTWAAAGMQLLSATCLVSGLSMGSIPLMAALIIGGYFFAGSGMVVVFSTIQEIVPAHSRGLAVGFAVLLFSLLGQGLGPLITGAAADYFTARHGSDSLRQVIQLAMIAGTAWICLHLLTVARALKATRGASRG